MLTGCGCGGTEDMAVSPNLRQGAPPQERPACTEPTSDDGRVAAWVVAQPPGPDNGVGHPGPAERLLACMGGARRGPGSTHMCTHVGTGMRRDLERCRQAGQLGEAPTCPRPIHRRKHITRCGPLEATPPAHPPLNFSSMRPHRMLLSRMRMGLNLGRMGWGSVQGGGLLGTRRDLMPYSSSQGQSL